MHLLKQSADGTLSLELFYNNIPKYAILSHRWVGEEPSFQDIQQGVGHGKEGFEKLRFCARRAAKDEFKYFWVDTVCINKESSAELTEALNSMYRWYQNAQKCYVYLSDVEAVDVDFKDSMWFTRGWTLQELIAPRVVEFYAKNETFLGTRKTLEEQIHAVTGIALEALRGQDLTTFSIEERVSWVQNRVTTREEDRSYCLLGIFDVFMPVIYGEGDRAFVRLLGEIKNVSKGRMSLDSIASLQQSCQTNKHSITPDQASSMKQLENYNACKRALHDPELLTRHDEIKSFTSSQWLFDHQTFRAWDLLDSSIKLLTLQGNPGTGKSVLIKGAARQAHDSETLMLHHYFDRTRDTKSSNFKSALDKFCTSLLYQLLDQLEPKPWSFLADWGELLRFKPGMMPWSLTQLQDAIREIIVGHEHRGNGKVRIFIDAVNECYNDENDPQPTQLLELLRWIDTLLSTATDAGADVRLCMSRTHLPSFGALEPRSQVIVVEDHNSPAIEAFVSRALKEPDMSPSLRHLLHHKIFQRCSNNFLWATVVTHDILANLDTLNESQILRLVDELPDSQKQLYQRALHNATGNTLRLLQMVWAAKRPLTADELRQSLAFIQPFAYTSITEWECSIAGFESGQRFENYLRKESRGLIEIYHPTETESYVRFIHESVAIFLQNLDDVAIVEASANHWTERCHFELLKACLRALDAPKSEAVVFNDYAAGNWVLHARECGSSMIDEIDQVPTFLLDCSKRKAMRIIERQITAVKESLARQSHLLADKEGLLVLLATLGCTALLKYHYRQCESCQDDVSLYSPSYRKALQNSIIGRYSDITMWLLETHIDADFNINEHYEDKTLLYKASYFGQTEVVTFLLDKGADPCKQSLVGYEYPIHAAIQLGRDDVIRILLGHSSSSDQLRLRRVGGYTPLHNAIESRQPARRKLAVLRLLLERAPRNAGSLDLKDDAGISVLELARKLGEGGEQEDILDEIEDFHDKEAKMAARSIN